MPPGLRGAAAGGGDAAHESINLFHARLHRVRCEDLELLLLVDPFFEQDHFGQVFAVDFADALKTAKYDKLSHFRPDRRKTNALLPF